jgi:hypothetical protein
MDWAQLFSKLVDALDDDGYLAIVGLDELADERWQLDLKRTISRYSTNQDFVPFDLLDELKERNLFTEHGYREFNSNFAQSIDDFIESIHACNGISRDRMSVRAALEFGDEIRALHTSHRPEARIMGTITARVWWGRPHKPSRD